MELLLLLFIFFIGVPLVKLLWRIWLVKRQFNKMRDQVNETFRAAQQQQEQATHEYERKKKKIDPSVGEFVKFEEINDPRPETEAPKSRPNLKPESQIEDAVWEEIK